MREVLRVPKEVARQRAEVEEAPGPVEEDCDGAAHEMMKLEAALEMEAETGLNSEVLQSHLSQERWHCSTGQAVPDQPGEGADAGLIHRSQQDCPFQLRRDGEVYEQTLWCFS